MCRLKARSVTRCTSSTKNWRCDTYPPRGFCGSVWRSQPSQTTCFSSVTFRAKTSTTIGMRATNKPASKPRRSGCKRLVGRKKGSKPTRSTSRAIQTPSGAEMADANARRNHRQNIRRKDDRDRRSPRPIASNWCQAICVVRKNFGRVVVLDFEYEIDTNLLPNVLCLVAYVLDENLRHVRTIRLWRGEFGSMPPFDIGSATLIIAYSAWAEMTCFKVLDWKFPVHIFDLHTAYLAASNVLVPYQPDETRKKPRKRLSDACRAFGIEGWEHIVKETMAKDIGEGNWRKYRKASVIDYCEEDVRMSVKLLRRILLGNTQFFVADVVRVLHWSNYSTKTTALIQA